MIKSITIRRHRSGTMEMNWNGEWVPLHLSPTPGMQKVVEHIITCPYCSVPPPPPGYMRQVPLCNTAVSIFTSAIRLERWAQQARHPN